MKNHLEKFLPKGKYEIWYVKSGLSRYYMLGLNFLKKSDPDKLPSKKDLSKTHVYLGSIDAKNLNDAYYKMQGEYWSPNGEARSLILQLNLSHTSMSVGDIIKVGNDVYMVENMGFKKLTEAYTPKLSLKKLIPLKEQNINPGDTILIQPDWSDEKISIKVTSIDSTWVNGIDTKDRSKFHIKKSVLKTTPFQLVENKISESPTDVVPYLDKKKTYKIDSGMGGTFPLKFVGVKNGKYYYKNISSWAEGNPLWDYELSEKDVLNRVKE